MQIEKFSEATSAEKQDFIAKSLVAGGMDKDRAERNGFGSFLPIGKTLALVGWSIIPAEGEVSAYAVGQFFDGTSVHECTLGRLSRIGVAVSECSIEQLKFGKRRDGAPNILNGSSVNDMIGTAPKVQLDYLCGREFKISSEVELYSLPFTAENGTDEELRASVRTIKAYKIDASSIKPTAANSKAAEKLAAFLKAEAEKIGFTEN